MAKCIGNDQLYGIVIWQGKFKEDFVLGWVGEDFEFMQRSYFLWCGYWCI